MVYKCCDCGGEWWREDCSREYFGGSGIIVCPDCEGSLKKEIGDVEEAIMGVLSNQGECSKDKISSLTGFSEEEVVNALKHLLDLSYVGATSKWNYRLGTKGREHMNSLSKLWY